MELDAPLEKIVTDEWDREAFKEELKEQERFQENMQKISMLAGRGKFDDALALVNVQLKAADKPHFERSLAVGTQWAEANRR